MPPLVQAGMMVGSFITANVMIYSRTTTAHVQAKLYENRDGEQVVEGLQAIREDSKTNSDDGNDSTSDSEATQNESMGYPSSDSDFCHDDAEDGSESDEDPAWLVAMNSSVLRQTPELYPAVTPHAMMVQEPLSDELSSGDDEHADHEEDFDGDEETAHRRRRFRLPAAAQAQQVPIAHVPTESVIANNYMREDAVMNLHPYIPRDEGDGEGVLHEQEGENEMELLLESSIDLRAQHQADHDGDGDEEDEQVVPGSFVVYDPASSSSE